MHELNPEQQAVVDCLSGPMLVIAGAGTGKTRVLAERTAALARQGIPAERILLLTFTRRAAEEMKSRIRTAIGPRAPEFPWCGTFHSCAVRALRNAGTWIGVHPGFTVLDETDSRSLVGSILADLFDKEERRRLPAKALLCQTYSYARNTGKDLEDALAERAGSEYGGVFAEVCRVCEAYEERKKISQALDYDDLLLRWSELLQHPEAAVPAWFDHVLVDEYQDTNIVQAEILVHLCRHHTNVMVVGDDAQAIYSFRGATVHNILEFAEIFTDARHLALSRNYRSTQAVLDAGNALIAEARQGFPKQLVSNGETGVPPRLAYCADDVEQAEVVAGEVERQWHRNGVPLREQAVLFRSAFHSFQLETLLRARGIPFRKFGGLRYADSSHVKDVVAFLRCRQNPQDETAWHRILELLPGVGTATAARIIDRIRTAGDVPRALGAISLPKRTGEWRQPFVSLLTELFEAERTPAAEVGAVLGFYGALLPTLHEDAEVRAAALSELTTMAARYRTRRGFLDDLSVGDDSVVGGGRRDDGEYLTLSTIHSAKGREWDCVYVIQVIEGGLPSAPSLGSEDDDVLEEERRLLYVAMTRARYGLTLFVPRRRRSFSDGSSTFKDCYPSRFLSHRVRSTCTENTGASPTPTPSGRPRTEPTPWDDPDPWIEPPTWDENNPFADDDPWPPGENSDSAADTGDGELYYDYNDV